MEMTGTAGKGDKTIVLKECKILVIHLSIPSQFGMLLKDPILPARLLQH